MSGFEHVSPGDKWQPSAIEINAMKDVARAYQGGSGVRPPGDGQAGWKLQPTCVRVINLTGRNIDRYTAFKIGGARWVLDADFDLPTSIFTLVPPDSNERANAIVQQPIKTNEIGYAAVAGPSLVKVTGGGATSDRWGLPNADGVLVPNNTTGTVYFTQNRPSGGGYVLAILGVGGAPPPQVNGGIAQLTSSMTARSGLTCGSASATKLSVTPAGVLSASGGSISILNTTQQIAPSGMIVQWKKSEDGLANLWDVGDCAPYTGGGLNQNPNPNPNP